MRTRDVNVSLQLSKIVSHMFEQPKKNATKSGESPSIAPDPIFLSNQLAEKWLPILSSLRAQQHEYDDAVCKYGWRGQVTEALPRECQDDITRLQRLIVLPNVLVINHGLAPYLRLDGTMEEMNPLGDDQLYTSNLDRILRISDPSKISRVSFDYPELYVLDSRRKLAAGELDSVILTPHSQGGSFFKDQAHQELGEGKTIYLAGCYAFFACLTATIEELWANDNEVVLIADAALSESRTDSGGVLARSELDQVIRSLNVDRIGTITTDEFIQRFGRLTNASI